MDNTINQNDNPHKSNQFEKFCDFLRSKIQISDNLTTYLKTEVLKLNIGQLRNRFQ
jgi:hypothetical protein